MQGGTPVEVTVALNFANSAFRALGPGAAVGRAADVRVEMLSGRISDLAASRIKVPMLWFRTACPRVRDANNHAHAQSHLRHNDAGNS
jgi:hypothetical protein